MILFDGFCVVASLGALLVAGVRINRKEKELESFAAAHGETMRAALEKTEGFESRLNECNAKMVNQSEELQMARITAEAWREQAETLAAKISFISEDRDKWQRLAGKLPIAVWVEPAPKVRAVAGK